MKKSKLERKQYLEKQPWFAEDKDPDTFSAKDRKNSDEYLKIEEELEDDAKKLAKGDKVRFEFEDEIKSGKFLRWTAINKKYWGDEPSMVWVEGADGERYRVWPQYVEVI